MTGMDLNWTVLQELLHQVIVLVAQEDARLELPAFLRQFRQDREVGDHVATPVLGQHQHVPRLRYVAKEIHVCWINSGRLLALVQAVLVLRHRGDELLVGHALFEAFARHSHATPTFRSLCFTRIG